MTRPEIGVASGVCESTGEREAGTDCEATSRYPSNLVTVRHPEPLTISVWSGRGGLPASTHASQAKSASAAGLLLLSWSTRLDASLSAVQPTAPVTSSITAMAMIIPVPCDPGSGHQRYRTQMVTPTNSPPRYNQALLAVHNADSRKPTVLLCS